MRIKAAARYAMRGLVLSAVILSSAVAIDLSESDRQAGIAQLNRTRGGVIEATRGLSDAQWSFKPGPDRWSIGETLEHIVLVESFLLENTAQKVMQAPPGPADRDYKIIDNLVLTVIADRTRKAEAPEQARPSGRWAPQAALEQFLKSRGRTVEFLKSTTNLRDHVLDSPLGQALDAYQWLLFISAHSERHTKQILEVKADPNYPKN